MKKKTCALGLAALLLLLLAACGHRHEQMLQQLTELERRNRADSVMHNDTLALQLTDYFDRHGTANERLRAHYILGRTYADMGEAPAALNAYLDAAECADTTQADCDFKTLSRVYGQASTIYHEQALPRYTLNALRLAERCAWMARDTIVAIEYLSQTADAYSMLKIYDSVVYIREKASQMFASINNEKESAKKLGAAITAAIKCGDVQKAGRFVECYESRSGVFDDSGNIQEGREIYYYIKANYYLATGQTDSAEHQLRKLLTDGRSLNDQIAASKGLEELYKQTGHPDSVAKYADRGYLLNDSAYSLAEMENIQRLKASYDYNRNRLLAEKEAAEADKAMARLFAVVTVAAGLFLASLLFFLFYRRRKQLQLLRYQLDLDGLEQAQSKLQELHAQEREHSVSAIKSLKEEISKLQARVMEYRKATECKRESIDHKLQGSQIVERLRSLLAQNPPAQASIADLRALKNLINENIPSFYNALNTDTCTLNTIEYEVCLLLRVRFSPAEISKLLGRDDGYISNLRRRILSKVYGIEGRPKDLDTRILYIQ